MLLGGQLAIWLGHLGGLDLGGDGRGRGKGEKEFAPAALRPTALSRIFSFTTGRHANIPQHPQLPLQLVLEHLTQSFTCTIALTHHRNHHHNHHLNNVSPHVTHTRQPVSSTPSTSLTSIPGPPIPLRNMPPNLLPASI